MGPHKMIVSECEHELIFQIVPVFGERIDLASHSAGMLANRQVVAFHAISSDGVVIEECGKRVRASS